MMDSPNSEFSRPIAVESLDAEQTRRDVEASEAERRSLATRFDVVAVNRLTAVLTLRRPQAGLVEVSGQIDAEVVQTCVVSLQEFASEIREDVNLIFTDQPEDGGPEEDGDDGDFEDIETEPPEPIVDGFVDIGEAVAQHLFLRLDSFPRAPGIEFEGYETEAGPGPANTVQDENANPFAKLTELKEKL